MTGKRSQNNEYFCLLCSAKLLRALAIALTPKRTRIEFHGPLIQNIDDALWKETTLCSKGLLKNAVLKL